MRFTIKLGGSILEEPPVRAAILGEVATLQAEGHQILLVHGGGKSLNRRLSQLGIESHFESGLRVTDDATLSVALMVLAGEVNKRLVAELQLSGGRAAGLSGADGGCVRCAPVAADGKLGFVGRPVAVDARFFEMLLAHGLVPVISSIGLGDGAQLYNVNADQMASACAWGTKCGALVYLTDVRGVKGADGTVLARLSPGQIARLRREGVIAGGMLPKTQACVEALERGVGSVYIVPGAHAGILRAFVDGTVTEGTCIHGHS